MELEEIVHNLAKASLTDDSLFVVDVIFSGKNAPSSKVLVIIDGDKGVTIDDCADVSKKLSVALDDKNIIVNKYILEVSTPGLDHPLKLTRQCVRNVGRSLKVYLKDKTIVQGKLVAASDAIIALDKETKEGKKYAIERIDLPYEQIEKAFVLVSFK